MQFTLSIAFCDAGQYVPLAREAEAAGWDSVCVLEGLFYYLNADYPYAHSETGAPFWTPETPYIDPFAAVAAMAAVTDRIGFYTNVLKLPVRHPLMVAKMATSLAALSGDRFGLGVGLSSWKQDYDVLGERWEGRGARSAEMVEIIRGLSRGGPYAHQGRFYTVPEMRIAPVPRRPIPVYFGGHADALLRRAARLGDGYIGAETAEHGLDALPALLDRLKRYLAEEGREEAGFAFKYVPGTMGTDTYRRLEALGIGDIVVSPWFLYPGDSNDLAHKRDCVRRFAEEVFPLFACE